MKKTRIALLGLFLISTLLACHQSGGGLVADPNGPKNGNVYPPNGPANMATGGTGAVVQPTPTLSPAQNGAQTGPPEVNGYPRGSDCKVAGTCGKNPPNEMPH